MLIRNYGEFWNPDIVDWGKIGAGNSGKLTGKVKIDKRIYEIDFWDSRGIYVLYNEFEPVYVGKAYKTSLGRRIRDHLSDRLAGRWDMFSWFSISSIRRTQNDVSKPSKRQYNPETINNTLEALAIIIANPRLNRKRETLQDAIFVEQPASKQPWAIRKYLQEILSKLNEKNNENKKNEI